MPKKKPLFVILILSSFFLLSAHPNCCCDICQSWVYWLCGRPQDDEQQSTILSRIFEVLIANPIYDSNASPDFDDSGSEQGGYLDVEPNFFGSSPSRASTFSVESSVYEINPNEDEVTSTHSGIYDEPAFNRNW